MINERTGLATVPTEEDADDPLFAAPDLSDDARTWLAEAKPLNPDISDDQLLSYYHQTYDKPDAAAVPQSSPKDLPSMEEWMAEAKPLNPKTSDAKLRTYWRQTYGKQGAPEKREPIGLSGTILEGAKSTGRSLKAAAQTYLGSDEGLVDTAKAQAEAPKDPKLQAMLTDIQQREAALGKDAGWLETATELGKAAWNNPKGAGLLLAEQIPNSVAALGSAGAGALAGSVFGPGGTIAGGLAGLFLGNTALETGGKAIEAASDGTVTPAERDAIKKEGAIKGGVVTALDAATLGVTKWITGTTARAVERATIKTLTDRGVNVADRAAVEAARANPDILRAVQQSADLAKAGVNTLGKKIGRGTAALGVESLGEGAGEYLGEYAATGEADKMEALIEAFSSLSQSAGEITLIQLRNRNRVEAIPDRLGLTNPGVSLDDTIRESQAIIDENTRLAEVERQDQEQKRQASEAEAADAQRSKEADELAIADTQAQRSAHEQADLQRREAALNRLSRAQTFAQTQTTADLADQDAAAMQAAAERDTAQRAQLENATIPAPERTRPTPQDLPILSGPDTSQAAAPLIQPGQAFTPRAPQELGPNERIAQERARLLALRDRRFLPSAPPQDSPSAPPIAPAKAVLNAIETGLSKAYPSPHDVRTLATEKGFNTESPVFREIVKAITKKTVLEELTPSELQMVADKLNRLKPSEPAKPKPTRPEAPSPEAPQQIYTEPIHPMEASQVSRSTLAPEQNAELLARAEKAQADLEIAGSERGGRFFHDTTGQSGTQEVVGLKSPTADWYKEATSGPAALSRQRVETAVQKILDDKGRDVGKDVQRIKELLFADREFMNSPFAPKSDAEWSSLIAQATGREVAPSRDEQIVAERKKLQEKKAEPHGEPFSLTSQEVKPTKPKAEDRQISIQIPPEQIGSRPIIGRETTPEESPLFSKAAQEPEAENRPLFSRSKSALRDELARLKQSKLRMSASTIRDMTPDEQAAFAQIATPAYQRAPTIGNTGLLFADSTDLTPLEVLGELSSDPAIHQIARLLEGATSRFQQALGIQSRASFRGLDVNMRHGGITVSGDFVGTPNAGNQIFLNPYVFAVKADEEIRAGYRTHQQGVQYVAQRLVRTLVHEITHQEYPGHDADFADRFQHNYDTLQSDRRSLITQLTAILEASDDAGQSFFDQLVADNARREEGVRNALSGRAGGRGGRTVDRGVSGRNANDQEDGADNLGQGQDRPGSSLPARVQERRGVPGRPSPTRSQSAHLGGDRADESRSPLGRELDTLRTPRTSAGQSRERRLSVTPPPSSQPTSSESPGNARGTRADPQFDEQGSEGAAPTTEQFKEAWNTGATIAGTNKKVVDSSQQYPQELIDELAKRPYVKKLTNSLGVVFKEMSGILKAADSNFGSPSFVGLSPDDYYVGVNLRGPDAVIVNPWGAMWRAQQHMHAHNLSESDANEYLAATLLKTMVHELTHQQVEGHDAQFNAQLEENYDTIGVNRFAAWQRLLMSTLQGETDALSQDLRAQQAFWSQRDRLSDQNRGRDAESGPVFDRDDVAGEGTSGRTGPPTTLRRGSTRETSPLDAGSGLRGRSAVAFYSLPELSRLDTVIRTLQDKNIDMVRLVDAIKQAKGQIADDLNPVQKEELYLGKVAYQNQTFLNDELKPLVDAMRLSKVSMAELEQYLHARHAKEANAYLQSINADREDNTALSGMTNEEAEKILRKADPKMETLAKRVDRIIDKSRKLMVEYGLESQETVNAWAKQYQHYVPLYREGKEPRMGTGQGRSVRGPSSKERVGSTRNVEDILAHIAMDREKVIVRGEKMKPVVALAGLLKLHPNDDIAKLAKPTTVTYTDPETGLETTMPGQVGEYNVPTISYKDPRTGQVVRRPDPAYKGRDNVVNFRVNGEDRAIIFNEDNERAMQIAHALKDLDLGNLNDLMAKVGAVTRYFAAINTQYNPIFGLINFIRDAQFAMLSLSSTPLKGKQAQIVNNARKLMLGIYKDARAVRNGQHVNSEAARMWERFQAVGGPTGYRDLFRTSADRAKAIQKLLDPDWWQKTTAGKVVTAGGLLKNPTSLLFSRGGKGVLDWLSDYNLTMENAMRLAVFKSGVDAGMSDEKAASIAKNITVNFNKKGQISAQAGALYAFFNASVQGTARLLEALFEPGKVGTLSTTGKKIVAGGITLGVIQAVALALGGFDDDEPPEFVKAKNLLIPAPGTDKGYISIPMPLGFHVLPAFGRLATEAMIYGNPGKKSYDFLAAMLDSFSPMGASSSLVQTLAPTATDPLVALSENQDWTGKPIYREDFSKLHPTPGHTRAKDSASAWSRFLSEAINYATGGTDYTPGVFSPSPDSLDFLVGQILGGIGREATKAGSVANSFMIGEDLPTYKIPLIGRFLGSSSDASSVRDEFYRNIRHLNEEDAELTGRRHHGEDASGYLRDHPEARFVDAANKMHRDIMKMQKRKREMVKSGASPETIRLIEQQMQTRMKRLNERMKLVSSR